MAQFKKTEKKIRTLPCDDCGTEVPVGDDAVGVVCTGCTQERLNIYERTEMLGSEDEGGDNLTVEEVSDKQTNSVQDKPRRTRIPKGRVKVRRAKQSDKQAQQRGKDSAD